MKPVGIIILSVITAVFASFLTFQFAGPITSSGDLAQIEKTETAYERVMRTGEIRCGYAMWPPKAVNKDLNTGEVVGIFPEIAEEMAKSLGLKLIWAEEVGWGNYIESLRAKRFDVFCAPLWRTGDRGKHTGYTIALAYSPLHFYARKDDDRFDENLSNLNSEEFTLSTLDGEMSSIVANRFFPKAKTTSLPQLADLSQLFINVQTGKADGVFSEPNLAFDFARKNPGTIRQVTKEPFQVFSNSFGMLLGEVKLQQMLNTSLIELRDQGIIDQIITKYEPDRSKFLPVRKPYEYIQPQPLD
jgi:ABC-type amino acid transport substrate-binding protein